MFGNKEESNDTVQRVRRHSRHPVTERHYMASPDTVVLLVATTSVGLRPVSVGPQWPRRQDVDTDLLRTRVLGDGKNSASAGNFWYKFCRKNRRIGVDQDDAEVEQTTGECGLR